MFPTKLLASSRFVLAGSPGELRSALLNMAGTVLATAGVVFTLLTLPLSTVAAQYGSRLLRLFLGDRTTQLVLGMFVGTFVYCIAGALAIPPVEVQPEPPQLTATVGLYLILGTFASLIWLVQHISTMLQAPNIAAAGGAELLDAVSASLPGEVTSGADRAAEAAPAVDWAEVEAKGFPVRARTTGYIQYVDPDIMLTLARERDLVVRLLRKPGHFVGRGAVIASVWPASRVDPRLEKQMRRAFQIGNMRTPTQDVEYAVRQLVEMAERAMSPAINDPYTAMTCLDYIGEGLALFIRETEQGARFFELDPRLSLAVEPVTFAELLDTAFDMLRHASCDNANVLTHMLETIKKIAVETKSLATRGELARHICLIEAEALAGDLIEQDRQAVQRSGEALLVTLMDSDQAQKE